MPVKRLNYFTHQLLREQDFKDEQGYHLEARHRHNRIFHPWGVVEGLAVVAQGREVVIEPGIAIDHLGREIILQESVTRDLSSFSADSDAYITIAFHEDLDDTDHVSAGGVEGYTRVTEIPEIQERRQEHLGEDALVLARAHIGQHGRVQHVDMSHSVRKNATERTAPHGWLRLPFKPVRLGPVLMEHDYAHDGSTEFDFLIDDARAYCGPKGARGSMQIPVPPAITHVTNFRVAGTTEGEVIARLFRTGWNVAEKKGEKTLIAEQTLTAGFFYEQVEVDSEVTNLDESHALAVSIRAQGKTEIWLVAAKVH